MESFDCLTIPIFILCVIYSFFSYNNSIFAHRIYDEWFIVARKRIISEVSRAEYTYTFRDMKHGY